MDYNGLINYLEEEKYYIPYNSYYHAFIYKEESFKKMLKEGIKAPIYFRKNNIGFNGNFYVSLSKHIISEADIYKLMINNPAFIISSKLKTIKAKYQHYYPEFIRKSILPLRGSVYDNEFQRLLKVNPKHFMGIRYNLGEVLYNAKSPEEVIFILFNIVNDLNNLDSNLPIIDLSTQKEIKKEKVLSLKKDYLK